MKRWHHNKRFDIYFSCEKNPKESIFQQMSIYKLIDGPKIEFPTSVEKLK
jgi:hypothetical protein